MRLELPTAAPSDIQVFTTSGTWAMPGDAASVHVTLIAGGGPGAAGEVAASAGVFASGGGGGSGAGWVTSTFPAIALDVSVPIVVGAGGYWTDNGGGGYSMTNATESLFGDLLRTRVGSPGMLGDGTYGSGSVLSQGSVIQGNRGGPPGWTGDAYGYAPDAFLPGCPGGGGGGSVLADGTVGDGGDGYRSVITAGTAYAPGGAAPGGNGSDGLDAADPNLPGPGVAGAGGASSATGNGGKGGNGGRYGAGGGGGGASIAPNYRGMGGDGGPGIVVVTTYF